MKIKDIAEVISKTIPISDLNPDTRFVGLEHYVSGDVLIQNTSGIEMLKTAVKKFEPGDTLVARRNVYLKRASKVDFEGVTSGDSIVLRPKSQLFGNVLPFVLNTDKFWRFAEKFSDGTMSKRLSPKTLLEYEFSLPEEEDLKKLITLLWSMNDTKVAYQRLYLQTNELVKAVFLDMFEKEGNSFIQSTIIEACKSKDDIKCGPFGTQLKQSEYKTSGVPIWGIPEINLDFKKSPDIFVSPDKAEQLSSYSLIPGDIAMSRKGNVGQCAIYPDEFEPGIIASDVLRIRVDNTRLIPKFMQYQLHLSEYVKHQIEAVSNGAVMAGINVTKLKKIKVAIPPLELQREFVSFANQSDVSKEELNNTLNNLNTMFRGIINANLQ